MENGETILLVEDDEPLRQLVARVLRNAGYSVLEAADGEDALHCSASHDRIDLLVTDVVMPRLGGVELARRLCALDADMRVMYMSGYSEGVVEKRGALQTDAPWITKPFAPTQLLHEVRNLLNAIRGGVAQN